MRIAGLAVLAVTGVSLGGTTADASPAEPPVHFEMGINTRRFQAPADGPGRIAFRTIDGATMDPSTESGVTMSLRFTKWTRYNTFVGVEAETGALLSDANSNVAGAYGLVGARGALGPVALKVEAAPGKRWIRYELHGKDYATWMAEARVRAETWISSRFTFGGAVGATVTGDANVWMAGVYLGVHSLDFGTKPAR